MEAKIHFNKCNHDTGSIRYNDRHEVEILTSAGNWLPIKAHAHYFKEGERVDNDQMTPQTQVDIIIEELREKVKEFSLGQV